MSNKKLRYLIKHYHKKCDAIYDLFLETGKYKQLPKFPKECEGMICGAKTRFGSTCKETTLCKNGRCRAHGGLSTGPKTLEGKRRSALNTGKTYEELLKMKNNK